MKFLEFNTIFVIESLRLGDEKTGTVLFNDTIRRGLMMRGMENNCQLFEISSKSELLSVFEFIKKNITYNYSNPIVHFETHGSIDGIQLSNNEIIEWSELQKIFIEINFLSENNLFITMATCFGGNIFKTINPKERSPFWGFVGAFDKAYPSEILFNFTAFYEEFLKSLDFNRAEAALNNANISSCSKFKFRNTTAVFLHAYENYEKKYLSPDIVEQRLNILACQAMNEPEFNGWDLKKTKAHLKHIMIDQQKELKEKMMTKFFSWDHFPQERRKE